jgi:hypothetical protein
VTIYNVEVAVIHLIAADSPEEARRKLRESLQRAGFEPDYVERDRDVFESDEQDVEPDLLP